MANGSYFKFEYNYKISTQFLSIYTRELGKLILIAPYIEWQIVYGGNAVQEGLFKFELDILFQLKLTGCYHHGWGQ